MEKNRNIQPFFDLSVFNNDAEMLVKEQQAQPQQVGFFRVRTANQCIVDAQTQPVPRSLFHNLIFEGEITILFADTGVGKSILSVQIADEISKTDKVLYIDLELSDKQFQSRYSENYQDEYVFNENLYRVDFTRPFKLPDGTDYDTHIIESIRQLITTTGAKIVIFDNMTKTISGDTDSARSAKPLMDCLNDLKFEYDLTLLLLEHTRKTDATRPISLNDLQGSKFKANFADAVFSIGRSAKDKNLRYVKQLKCRSAEVVYDIDNVPVYEIIKENSFLHFKYLEFDTEFNHLKQPSETDTEQLKQKAFELKEQNVSNREIGRQVGKSEATIRKWFKAK